MAESVAQRVRWNVWLTFVVLSVGMWIGVTALRGTDAVAMSGSIVIDEIHYNPAIGGVEFIELHSLHNETIDLSGYVLSALLTIPDGTLIDPGGFVVVTADLAAFQNLYPGVPALEWNTGESLDDAGEQLVLTSSLGEVVDEVTYGLENAGAPYTVDQVIDGTIGAGDGANPNEEAPMGLHDAPLYLPQGWNWAQGPTRNSEWGTFGTGSSLYAEWRCAVIPEFGHNPPVPFRVNVRNGSYWQFANGVWSNGFDVNLTGGHRGSYLGDAGQLNTDPYSNGRGQIGWRQEADGSFSAPWDSNALMMHFWASQRLPALPGQTAELSTSEVRLQQPDNGTVDLSLVNVLFQCGLDYYSVTTGQGTQVPGPGIGKYHRATTSWKPSLWTTLPAGAPAASTEDFRAWLAGNLPPNVQDDLAVPWPTEPNGGGPSLELIDPTVDNNLPGSWKASDVAGTAGGTPGAANVVVVDVVGPVVVVESPVDGGVVVAAISLDISGSSSDDYSGVDRVGVRVWRTSPAPDEYWDGAGWVSTDAFVDAVLNVDGTWVLPDVDLTILGSYRVQVIGYDVVGNVSLESENGSVDFSVTGPPATCNGLAVTIDLNVTPGALATAGNDVILGTAVGETILGAEGDDTICGGGGNDIISGELGNDTIFGGAGADTINAGAGDDWVDAGEGDDMVFGLDGDDTIFGGLGADELIGFGGLDYLDGGDGADTINGGADADQLFGGPGADRIFGQGGNDIVDAGAGDDFVIGVDGDDVLNGGPGADVLNGGPGSDTIHGDGDVDTIFGLGGDDMLFGDAGNDFVFGQLGVDTIDGGPGDDMLWGNEDNDTMTDPSGANTMNGGPGSDTVTGGVGDDTIFGDGNLTQAGDDILDGGLGADLVLGFAGNDVITANDGVADVINGGPHTIGDTCTVDVGVDTVFNCNP